MNHSSRINHRAIESLLLSLAFFVAIGTRAAGFSSVPVPLPGEPPLQTVATRPQLSPELFSNEVSLAVQLFNDGDYSVARTESERVRFALASNSVAFAEARVLSAISERMERGGGELTELWRDETIPQSARLAAAYIAGTQILVSGDETRSERMQALAFVFLNSDNPALFWNSGCLLYLMMKNDKAACDEAPLLWSQLETVSSIWPVAIVRACRELLCATGERESPPLPVELVVKFYRKQISPAIGERCLIEPSCSRYFMEACRRHGWLGIGIGADRFFREPTLLGDREREVIMQNGAVRYADPVSSHDFWL